MSTARAFTLALLIAAPAAAAPCDFVQPEAGAPTRVPLGPSALGTIPEACAANEAAVQAYLAALIASDDFYGYLHLVVAPRVRLVLPGGPWVSAMLPGFSYWFAANATVEADQVELDAGALGLHLPLPVTERLQLAPYVRLLVPSSAGYANATRYGFDHGVASVLRLTSNVELAGGFGFPAVITANGTTLHVTSLPGAAGDVVWAPWSWLGLVGGLGARARLGPDRGFAAIDLRSAIRAYVLGGLRFELGALLPIGGSDRTDVIAALSVGWVQAATARRKALSP